MMPLNSIWLEGTLVGNLTRLPSTQAVYRFQVANDGVYAVEINAGRITGEPHWFQDGKPVRVIGRLYQKPRKGKGSPKDEIRIFAELLEPGFTPRERAL